MTGRERIEAAFSENGTPEIPVIVPSEKIYIRDHWRELTSAPWWYQESPDIEQQMLWRREVIAKTGQDWFVLPPGYSREDRKNIFIENQPSGTFRVDRRTGKKEEIIEPQIGGGLSEKEKTESIHPNHIAGTLGEIDGLIPAPPDSDPKDIAKDGRADLAAQLLKEFGKDLYPVYFVRSPLWECYYLWGFEGMMIMIASRPDLVMHACERFLRINVRRVREAAVFGAEGIYINDCLSDLISPKMFNLLNISYLKKLVEEIHSNGLKSIYFFYGNPAGKWEHILSAGANALALEESKKDFSIDIEDVVTKVQKRCVVLGNLDAIGILQDGTEEQVQAEILRQIVAGRQNKGRFIMSLGSPVTPATTVKRVRLYCDLAHNLGRIQ